MKRREKQKKNYNNNNHHSERIAKNFGDLTQLSCMCAM